MKRFFLFAMLLMLFSACSPENEGAGNNSGQSGDEKGDIEVDLAPLCMMVYVNDADGNNLLDPASAHCLDHSKIILTYNGEEYPLVNEELAATPSAYLALFEGALLAYDVNNVAYLYIGEWDSGKDWSMCNVAIAWGDGTTTSLSFSHDVSFDKEYQNDPDHNYGYTFSTQWYLNGESHPNFQYNIVK